MSQRKDGAWDSDPNLPAPIGPFISSSGTSSFQFSETVRKNKIICGPNLNNVSNRQVGVAGLSFQGNAERIRLDTKSHRDNVWCYKVFESASQTKS
jgi:hypothetical protein